MLRLAAAALLVLTTLPAAAQQATQAPQVPAPVAATSDEPIPRAERARARQECYADNSALSGQDLRAAMRECMQGRFPHVQLYARDGLTRDGRPTATAARAACKGEADERGLAGSERRAALVACFNAKRPDLAQRSACRREARGKGLDGPALRQAVEACAREARS